MIVSLCAGLSSISLAGSVATPLSGIDTQFIDHRARPQDDFYRYVNGLWIDSTSIAPDKERVSPSSLLDDAIKLQLREIIEAALRAPDPADPDGQKIATLYASFLDVAAAERRGLGPLRAELARINGLKTRGELAMTIGRLGQFGVRTPIGNAVLNDPDNPDLQTLFLYQAGLGMPSRDYYLGDEARLRQVRDAYLAHVDRMLGLAGDKDSPIAPACCWLSKPAWLGRNGTAPTAMTPPRRITVAASRSWPHSHPISTGPDISPVPA